MHWLQTIASPPKSKNKCCLFFFLHSNQHSKSTRVQVSTFTTKHMRKYLCAPPIWYLIVRSWNCTYRKYQFKSRQTIRQYYHGIIHWILSRNNYTQPSAACTPWKPAYVGFSAAWQQAVSKCMGSGELMLMRFSFCISTSHAASSSTGKSLSH